MQYFSLIVVASVGSALILKHSRAFRFCTKSVLALRYEVQYYCYIYYRQYRHDGKRYCFNVGRFWYFYVDMVVAFRTKHSCDISYEIQKLDLDSPDRMLVWNAGTQNVRCWDADSDILSITRYAKLFITQNVSNFNGCWTNLLRIRRYLDLKFRIYSKL